MTRATKTTRAARQAHRAGQSAALSAFRRLPRRVRQRLIRAGAPLFTVGAVVVIQDDTGRVLMVRQRHTGKWALPGGLLRRGEDPLSAAVRELGEELNVHLDRDVLSAPVVNLDPRARRVDFIYPGPRPSGLRPDGVETVEAGWHAPSALPRCIAGTDQILARCGIR